MGNITKFPINKTRPSDDNHKRLKFDINVVMASEEFKQWLADELSDYEFLNIISKMLPGDKIPPSYDEFMQSHAVIKKAIIEFKEFKLLQENRPKNTP